MKKLFRQRIAIKRVLLLALVAGAVILSGCGQQAAQRELRIGQNRWVRVNDELIQPANPENPPTIMAETFLATGRLVESQGNFIQAAKLYQRACKTRLDYVAAWNRLGIVCDKLGRYKQAEESFTQGLNWAPEAAFLHNNLGFSYLLAGKYVQAETCLRQALALRPQFQRARVNLGLALAKQGQFDEALSEFERALPQAQAYYNMGYVHRQAGQWQKAADCYKLALELDPDLGEAKTSLALLAQSHNTNQ